MQILAAGRTAGSAVLIVVACVLVPVTTTAAWVRTTVSVTERYVATVAPLAEQASVQDYVADHLTERVMAAVDEAGVLADAVDRLVEQQGLPPRTGDLVVLALEPVRDGLERRVHDLAVEMVASDAFTTAWREANAGAHERLMAALRGEKEAGGVQLNLAIAANTLRLSLVERDVPFADRLPEVPATLPLAGQEELDRVRGAYGQLDAWTGRLAVLAVLCPVAGIALARRRRRAVLAWLAGSVLAVVLALGLLAVGLEAVVGRVDGDGTVARAVLDVLTDRVRWLLWGWVAVLVTAVGVMVATGPGPRTRAARERAVRAVGGVRDAG